MAKHKYNRWNIAVTVLVTAVFLLSGLGGLMAPSRFGAVPATAVLAYPFLLCIVLILGLYWCVRKRWKLALAILASILCTWPSLTSNFPLHLPTSRTEMQAEDCSFRVMSYNVAAFSSEFWSDTTQMHPDMRMILDIDADFVVLLQPNSYGLCYDQFRSIAPWLREVEHHYPYRTHSRYDGVELMSKYPFSASALTLPHVSYQYWPYIIRATHAFAFDIDIPGKQLRLIAAYMTSFELDDQQRRVLDSVGYPLPSPPHLYAKMHNAFAEREIMSKHLRDSLDTSPSNVVFCADMNDVDMSFAYRTLMGGDMIDPFVECHTGPIFTFREHNMLFHIDHIMYRGSLHATDFKLIKDGYSDHYPIMTTFRWED